MILNDVVYTDYPDECLNWKCEQDERDHTLKPSKNGFMSCPICSGSYGETKKEFNERKNEKKIHY